MRSSFKFRPLVMAAIGCVSLGGVCRADVKNIPALKDLTMFGTGNNNGAGPGMFVGTDGGSAPKRGLIEFDIQDNIPAGATITSATLSLTLGMVAGSGMTSGDGADRDIKLFALTRDWGATTNGTGLTPKTGFGGTGGGSAPHTGDATWNFANFNTVPWTTPGGDFVSTPSADTAVGESVNSAYTWSSAGMVADIQSWLNGTTANDGWLLMNDETQPTDFRAFYTKEGVLEETLANGQAVPASFAPNLSVTFTVPEPASMSVLVLGAPLMLRRRRAIA